MNKINNIEQLEHFFFDGYSIDEKELANVGKVHFFIQNINKYIFKNKGKIVLIPYFNGKIKSDGGVSGIVIGENFHFTCHTFCYKNTMFIDYFGDKTKQRDVHDLILDSFPTDDYDLCKNNQNIKGNFGKHIIIRPASAISFEEAKKLTSVILKEIDMTPINNLITHQTSENQFDILQPIAESHISFHRTNDKMVVDAFSCKYFDEKKLLSLLDNPETYTEINRGIRFK